MVSQTQKLILESLTKRSTLFKELMQQLYHLQQECLQKEQGLTKFLDHADKKHVHVCRFYFATSVVDIIVSVISHIS